MLAAVCLLVLLLSSCVQAAFVRQDGKKYYYKGTDQVLGWMKKGRRTYYFDPDNGGAAATGYLKLGKKGYYFKASGVLVKNRFVTSPEGSTYYANKKGLLSRGLKKINNRYYYFDRTTHVMTTGWVRIKKGTYYMKGAGKQKGSAVIGWMRKDRQLYYFGSNGRMMTGIVNVGGRKYYFDPETGAMQKGIVNVNGKTMNFGNNGIVVTPTGPWNIKVNQNTNTVTVYRGTTPVKAFACSVGVNGATPDGTFQIRDKLRWHELMGPSWGQWCEHLTSDILFHSIPYNAPNDKYSMSTRGYNMLGSAASHGCIRLAASSAKYIYDNVPIGSRVVIFHGSRKDDPLGKPMTPYVGSWGKTYDPTDPTV